MFSTQLDQKINDARNDLEYQIDQRVRAALAFKFPDESPTDDDIREHVAMRVYPDRDEYFYKDVWFITVYRPAIELNEEGDRLNLTVKFNYP